MRVYSYVVKAISGFAPNPYWGWCTLACCKPKIRKTAVPGDWIIGLAPKSKGSQVVYVMQVDEVLTIDGYWHDKRFAVKRPDWQGQSAAMKGDNIYEPLGGGEYRQLRSLHSRTGAGGIFEEDAFHKERDLSGEHVLISQSFAYYGERQKFLPPSLNTLRVGRGHRSRFPDNVIEEAIEFAKQCVQEQSSQEFSL
jgi:hypothetical protein